MNRVAKTSIVLGAALLCSVSLAQAESRGDIAIRTVVAQEIVSNHAGSNGFKWESAGSKAIAPSQALAEADFGKSSSFKWEARGATGEIARAGAETPSSDVATYFPYEPMTQTSATQQGFRWAIRNTAQQQGFRWAIRSTAQQQGFRWAIRNTAQQQGFRWAIR